MSGCYVDSGGQDWCCACGGTPANYQHGHDAVLCRAHWGEDVDTTDRPQIDPSWAPNVLALHAILAEFHVECVRCGTAMDVANILDRRGVKAIGVEVSA